MKFPSNLFFMTDFPLFVVFWIDHNWIQCWDRCKLNSHRGNKYYYKGVSTWRKLLLDLVVSIDKLPVWYWGRRNNLLHKSIKSIPRDVDVRWLSQKGTQQGNTPDWCLLLLDRERFLWLETLHMVVACVKWIPPLLYWWYITKIIAKWLLGKF